MCLLGVSSKQHSFMTVAAGSLAAGSLVSQGCPGKTLRQGCPVAFTCKNNVSKHHYVYRQSLRILLCYNFAIFQNLGAQTTCIMSIMEANEALRFYIVMLRAILLAAFEAVAPLGSSVLEQMFV